MTSESTLNVTENLGPMKNSISSLLMCLQDIFFRLLCKQARHSVSVINEFITAAMIHWRNTFSTELSKLHVQRWEWQQQTRIICCPWDSCITK